MHGGLMGVLLGGLLAGYLSRRLDGMLADETSRLVKSIAIAWISVLWMVWGSGTTWTVMILGAMAIPALIARFSILNRAPRQLPNINYVHPRENLDMPSRDRTQII